VTTTTEPAGGDAFVWERVNLGNVSAYILERSGEAVLVDTGLGGSAGEIETALTRLGLAWANLGHIILTHRHRDHVGSIDAVLAAAPDATGYIGEADAAAVSAPRPLTILNGGDSVFDLDIVATPGHTPGSISVFDPIGRILVSGDAVLGGAEPGSVAGANPRFSDDMGAADQSVKALAPLQPGAILPGHGEPITADAATKLDALATSL
jgi:glyoxylase-like metal-dependent hydrolase (beta-lactamase superfamily II)